MKKHINIPIFIPHLGCPNQCVFCNQRSITGTEKFDADSVIPIIEEALATVSEDTEAEIAFFGGSFTGIDYDLMCRLLEIANAYVTAGRVKSIRCSTRPDYITQEILDALKIYNVSVIELGLQSIDEAVLINSKRGHSFSDEKKAVKLILENGFELVGQMMIGLPEATPESEIATARFICDSGAKAARVYPTVVFRDTELCEMTKKQIYEPLTEAEAVKRTAEVLRIFAENNVKVIRIGLCASEKLTSTDSYFAGPNHPALGELCENRVFYSIIREKLKALKMNSGAVINVRVPRGALSKAIGQNKKNKQSLISEFSLSDILFLEDKSLSGYVAECEERKNKCI